MRSCCSLARVPPRPRLSWKPGGSVVPAGHRTPARRASGRGRGAGCFSGCSLEKATVPPRTPRFCRDGSSVGQGHSGHTQACGQAAGTGTGSKQKSSYSDLPHLALPRATGHLLSPASDVTMARARRVFREDIFSSAQHGARSLCFVLRSYS